MPSRSIICLETLRCSAPPLKSLTHCCWLSRVAILLKPRPSACAVMKPKCDMAIVVSISLLLSSDICLSRSLNTLSTLSGSNLCAKSPTNLAGGTLNPGSRRCLGVILGVGLVILSSTFASTTDVGSLSYCTHNSRSSCWKSENPSCCTGANLESTFVRKGFS